MQQTIQLDISSDIFDKVMFWLENLPKTKVTLKEINNISTPSNDYFSSKVDKYIFALYSNEGSTAGADGTREVWSELKNC